MRAVELVPRKQHVVIHQAVQNALAPLPVNVRVLASEDHEELRAILCQLPDAMESVALHRAYMDVIQRTQKPV